MSASTVLIISSLLRSVSSGRCDARLPIEPQCVYAVGFKDAQMSSCPHEPSFSFLKFCEGPSVLKKVQCHAVGRAVCSECANRAYWHAFPSSIYNGVPNFGVTPICDSCPVSAYEDDLTECKCEGPLRRAGAMHDRDLCLCLECRRAYNVEKFQAADDMARSFMYVEKDKHTNALEYLPNAKVKHAKLPTCPCGNVRLRSEVSKDLSKNSLLVNLMERVGNESRSYKFSECRVTEARGMCVWCGALKLSTLKSMRYAAMPVGGEIAEQGSHKLSMAHAVLKAEDFTALQRQIEQKGVPPPLIKGANKYWSYEDVAGEPRSWTAICANDTRQIGESVGKAWTREGHATGMIGRDSSSISSGPKSKPHRKSNGLIPPGR